MRFEEDRSIGEREEKGKDEGVAPIIYFNSHQWNFYPLPAFNFYSPALSYLFFVFSNLNEEGFF